MNFAYAAGFHFLKAFYPVKWELSTLSTEFSTAWFVATLLTWSGLHATTGQLSETHGAADVGNLHRHRQR